MAKIDLSTAASRTKLEPRRHEYFQAAGSGYVGFYRSPNGRAADAWCGRWRDPASGKQHTTRLPEVAALPLGEQFAAASAAVQDWVKALQRAAADAAALGEAFGLAVPQTVGDALTAYLASGKDPVMGARTARLVLGGGKRKLPVDPLAGVKLSDPHLKNALAAWRKRMTGARGTGVVNREMTPLRSALNAVAELIAAPRWQEALKPGDRAKGDIGEALGVYRSKAERLALLNEMTGAALQFFTAMQRLPVRPGMLAELNVGHFNRASNEIIVDYDKKHPRTIAIPAALGAHFREACGNRGTSEPLFLSESRARWTRKGWDVAIKLAAAVAAAKRGTGWEHAAVWSAYDFRHSTITDLIEAGVSVASVAKIAGTSPEMIYRRYHHLLDRQAVTALELLE